MTEERCGPLSGLRIVDMTKVIMGPFATQVLADQGADVITVEGPGTQTNRVMGDCIHDELSGISLNLLRNKKSVELDLQDQEDLIVLQALIRTADVLITTLRPGSMARLGLDYESCRRLNESIVYCHGQGHPIGSGAEDAPAYDDVIQAASGIADITNRTWGTPTLLPTIIADKVAGLVIAQAVLAGIYERSVTGTGQRIEVPMTQAVSSFMLVEHGSGAIYAEPDVPTTVTSGYKRLLTPERRPHATADGHVHLFPYQPRHYRDLFADFGEDLDVPARLYSDKRSVLHNAARLYSYVRSLAVKNTTDEWLSYCSDRDIPVTPVRSIADIVNDLEIQTHPVVGDYRVIQPLANFSSHPFRVRHHAPVKGQHTKEVHGTAEGGYSACWT